MRRSDSARLSFLGYWIVPPRYVRRGCGVSHAQGIRSGEAGSLLRYRSPATLCRGSGPIVRHPQNLKLRAAYRSRKGDHVPDILHACDVAHQALEAETEPGVRDAPIAA